MDLLTFCILFLYFAPSRAVEYTNSLVLANGTYNVSWAYKNTTDMFYFKVRAKATGWIGFGVTKLEFEGDKDGVFWSKTGMDSLDIVVGGVSGNGTNYYNVSNATQRTKPCKARNVRVVSPETRFDLQVCEMNHHCTVLRFYDPKCCLSLLLTR